MMRAGANFRRLPVVLAEPASRNVAEVISAPCAGASTSVASGMVGSIQCRLQADIDVAAVFALDLEPVDEFLAVAFAVEPHPAWRSRRARSAWRGGRARAPPLRCAHANRFRACRPCRRGSCADRRPGAISGAASRAQRARECVRRLRSAHRPSPAVAGFARIEAFAVVAARRDMRVGGRQKRFAGPARHARSDAAARSSLRRPARRAAATASSSADCAASSSATRSFSRSSSPRARLRARPSGPRIQRRSSAISQPETNAEKPESAASNR